VVTLVKKLVLFSGLTVLAGCGETAFQDAFDAGKFSPDETQVRSNKSLTLPPDLQLRAPAGGAAPQQDVASNNQPPVTTQPPQYGAAPAQPRYGAPAQPSYGAPAQPVQRQAATPRAGGDPYMQNIYRKWGVSEYRADGSKKTERELIEELRQKKLAQQRAKNPNYGTVFNLPKVWSDGG
jgi:hypothetical protein